MRGDVIIVRAYRDEPLLRRVWEADENVVLVTDDAQFAKLMKGQEAIQPVCFHRADIFALTKNSLKIIRKRRINMMLDWSKLRPY